MLKTNKEYKLLAELFYCKNLFVRAVKDCKNVKAMVRVRPKNDE